MLRFLYGSNVLAAVNLLEELLPFIDVIPTAPSPFCWNFSSQGRGRRCGAATSPPQKQSGRRRTGLADVVDVKATIFKDDDEKMSRR
jgi:hypothetical protein